MRDFLVFRLAGPMAAFGDIAVGERRGIWDVPSKSAVMGLLAAALGLRRNETEAQRALDEGLGFAARIDAPGRPLRDYHTAQAPKARRGATWRTRRDELADRDELNTVLSERIYRLELSATIGLWRKSGTGPSLVALAEALRSPHFAPYIGRKACPLGRPPQPALVGADGLLAAFASYDADEAAREAQLPAWSRPRKSSATPLVWFEWDAGLAAEEALAQASGRIRQRRDAVRDRARWQYTDRREGAIDQGAPEPGAAS